MIEATADILLNLGLTFGIGSSTFALIFYIVALVDGAIDDSEKRFMKAVYVVLRLGMLVLTLSLVGFAISGGVPGITAHLSQWVLLIIITTNAILMSHKKISMKIGPVLAGGSWYSLFFVSLTPLGNLSGIAQLCLYTVWLFIFYIAFHKLRRKFNPAKPPVSNASN